MSQGELLINGAWVQGKGTSFIKTNPVSNQQIWSGYEANVADVEAACNAARTAFPAWARLGLEQRVAIIERFASLLEQNKINLHKSSVKKPVNHCGKHSQKYNR